MNQRIVITVEGGVDRFQNAPSMHEAYLPKLRSMKHGDSFFVPDLLSAELVGLIAFARDSGVYLNTVTVDSDLIYRTQGTRVWCVAESEFEQLSDADWHYYLHIRSGLTYKVRADIPPSKDSNVVRIGEADYLQRPDYTGKYFNWMDADGTTWWKNSKGEPIAKPEAEMLSGQHQRIDKANYEALLYSMGKVAGQDGSFVGTPATPTPHDHDATKLPDRASDAELKQVTNPDAEKPMSDGELEAAIRSARVTEVQEQNLETYWRKTDGTIVAVPAAKIYAAMKTKGAVEVDRVTYVAWLAAKSAQDDDL